MTQGDAAMFPVYASGALFGMYCLFKVFGKEYVNLLVGGYFFLVGIAGATRACRPIGEALLPASLTANPYKLVFSQQVAENDGDAKAKETADKADKADDKDAKAVVVKPADEADAKAVVVTPDDEALIFDMSFDYIDLACLGLATAVGIVYIFTKVEHPKRLLHCPSFKITSVGKFICT